MLVSDVFLPKCKYTMYRHMFIALFLNAMDIVVCTPQSIGVVVCYGICLFTKCLRMEVIA